MPMIGEDTAIAQPESAARRVFFNSMSHRSVREAI